MERMLVMRKHMVALCDHKTEQHGMKEARKHVGWYVKRNPWRGRVQTQSGIFVYLGRTGAIN